MFKVVTNGSPLMARTTLVHVSFTLIARPLLYAAYVIDVTSGAMCDPEMSAKMAVVPPHLLRGLATLQTDLTRDETMGKSFIKSCLTW